MKSVPLVVQMHEKKFKSRHRPPLFLLQSDKELSLVFMYYFLSFDG